MSTVWFAFLCLNQTRQQGFSGPLPISYTEIKSWMETTGNYLLFWEVEAIKRLDTVYLEVVTKK